jgi:hypothetical protein
MGSTPPSSSSLAAIFQVLSASLGLTVLGLWAIAYWSSTDPTNLERDWYCLWTAGEAFISGEWEGMYAQTFSAETHDGVCQEGYFWLYPPYALYAAALPALLPASIAYLALTLGIFSCFGGFLWVVRALYPEPSRDYATFALGTLSFAPLHTVIITGQNSAWLLFALAGGLLALTRERLFLAACCFAVIGLKPNWIVLFIAWFALRGMWKLIAMIAALGAGMLLSTVPLGTGLWWQFQESTAGYGSYVLSHYPVDKLITSNALLRAYLTPEGPLFYGLWVLMLAAVLGSCLLTWRSDRSLFAQAALTVLATISCNVYTNFYDALFLLVPAALWWFERERYATRSWQLIGLMLAMCWGWTWLNYFILPGAAPLHLGLFLVVWAVAEGAESLRRSASSGNSK